MIAAAAVLVSRRQPLDFVTIAVVILMLDDTAFAERSKVMTALVIEDAPAFFGGTKGDELLAQHLDWIGSRGIQRTDGAHGPPVLMKRPSHIG